MRCPSFLTRLLSRVCLHLCLFRLSLALRLSLFSSIQPESSRLHGSLSAFLPGGEEVAEAPVELRHPPRAAQAPCLASGTRLESATRAASRKSAASKAGRRSNRPGARSEIPVLNSKYGRRKKKRTKAMAVPLLALYIAFPYFASQLITQHLPTWPHSARG